MKNIIYGAGFYSEIICEELEKNNIKIDFIIDQYTNRKKILDKKIKRLHEVDLKDFNVYVTITSPLEEVQVINELRAFTNKKIFSFQEILFSYSNIIKKCLLKQKLWYSEDKSLILDYSKLNSFKKLIAEEKSLELLKQIINFRKTLSKDYIISPTLEPQYFPSDINLFNNTEAIRFVDGGAFTGDTLESSLIEFGKLNKNIDYIACFEPYTVNIKKLNQEILKQKTIYSDTKIFAYPCGLWSSNKILEFNNNGSSNSSITTKTSYSKTQIMTIALDDALIGTNPNYIKLDIEGAEKEAIAGMKEILKTNSPTLAICLYHKPNDLWDLPLLINEINPNYNMYLRIYGHLGIELVLYCVPK